MARVKLASAKLVPANMTELYAVARGVRMLTAKTSNETAITELARIKKEFEMERKKYQDHINYLEETLTAIKGNVSRWVFQLTDVEDKLKRAQAENEQLKSSHASDMERVKRDFEREHATLIQELAYLKAKVAEFDLHFSREIAVNQVIQKRQQTYINVLKGEVVAAKSIIGNKKLRDKALSDLNFDKVFYYEHKPKLQEESSKEN